ncbi:MAG: protease inhibitor I9 family protein, partial [Actinomycetota bacterium]|nr:protease inhibitor I9 family protein [Actinomycetota bacterium]
MLSFTVAAMLLACTGSVFAQDTAAPAVSESTDGDVAPDRYIVVLRDDAAQTSERVASEQAGRLGLEVSQTYRNAIKGYAARIPADRLEEVRADPNVAYVEPDRIVKATEQSLPYGINLIDADL